MFDRFSSLRLTLDTSRFLAVYGRGVYDTYLAADHQQVSFLQALAITLQDLGFQAIAFSSPHRTRFFLDKTSSHVFPLDPANAENPQPPAQIAGPLGTLNLLPARDRQNIPINDTALIQSFDRALRDQSVQKALVIQGAVSYFPVFKNQRLINGILADWLSLPPDNQNRVIAIFSDPTTESFLGSLEKVHLPVLRPYFTERDAQARLCHAAAIQQPEKDEISRLFAVNSRKIRPEDSEKLLRLIASENRLISEWARMIDSSPEISLDQAYRSGWIQSRIHPDLSAFEQLNQLTGLEAVKETVRKISAYQQLLNQRGIKDRGTLNFIFSGNPGTGKTTVARLMGEIFHDLGILKRGHLVQVSAGDLIGSHVGETAVKTNEVIDRALDGVLFIDEAYSLSETDRGGFGLEALETLILRIENDRQRLMVILAGYPEKMDQLLRANPGLSRRIPEGNRIHFPNYSQEELIGIFFRLLQVKGLTCGDELKDLLPGVIETLSRGNQANFGNAGEIRNLVDEMTQNYARRNEHAIPGDLILTVEDLPDRLRTASADRSGYLQSAVQELESMIGLESVKEFLIQMTARLKLNQLLDNQKSHRQPQTGYHFIFYGNPGTGKTTVAHLMGKMLYAVGALGSPKVLEVTGRDLIAEYVGQSAGKTRNLLLSALDGVLFIDEAYTLTPSPTNNFAVEVIAEIIKGIDRYQNRLSIILAGYPEEMARFLESNPGLASRFPFIINFPNYSIMNLTRILVSFARQDKIAVPDPVLQAAAKYLHAQQSMQKNRFGNARSVKVLYEMMKNRMAVRLFSKSETSFIRGAAPHLAFELVDVPEIDTFTCETSYPFGFSGNPIIEKKTSPLFQESQQFPDSSHQL